jgi:hypothetical protein
MGLMIEHHLQVFERSGREALIGVIPMDLVDVDKLRSAFDPEGIDPDLFGTYKIAPEHVPVLEGMLDADFLLDFSKYDYFLDYGR